MTLDDLLPAPQAILENLGGIDLRGQAYLRTYPSILETASQQRPATMLFPVVSCLAYGWMPRILRHNGNYFDNACTAYAQATEATVENWQDETLTDMQSCLHSLVGASKVAHFCNPDVFPIWDSNVEALRVDGDLDNGHMTDIQNYRDYAAAAQAIIDDDRFPQFSDDLKEALAARLAHLNIPNYDIGPLRVVDIAAFELA